MENNINIRKQSVAHKGSRENIIRKNRSRKRKFHGGEIANDTKYTSTASKKLRNSGCFDVIRDQSVDYAFISFNQVFLTLSSFVKCKVFDDDINFVKTRIKGLGYQVSLHCKCNPRVID